MIATFYVGFEKRMNSTKLPNVTGVEHDVKLKEDCSKHDPVLLLASQQYDYEYAKIKWGASGPTCYYFVTDVVSKANNIVEYHLSEDVLATYKDDIGRTSAHITYSTSDYNKMIVDPRIQVFNKRTVTGSTSLSPVVNPNSEGYFLLTVFNNKELLGDDQVNNVATGLGVTYYLTALAMKDVRAWFSSQSMVQALQDFFGGDPLDGVLHCKWIPYTIPNAQLLRASYIHIGSQQSPSIASGCYVVDGFQNDQFQLTVDVNLLYRGGTPVQYGNDFRAAEPYTTGDIYLPGVGVVDICMKDWIGEARIYIDVVIEMLTGNVKYFLKNASGRIMQTAECNIAYDVPIGRMSSSASNVVSGLQKGAGGIVNLIGGILSENPLMAASGGSDVIAGASSAVLSTLHTKTSIIGNYGGRTIQYDPYIRHTEYSIDTQNFDIPAYKDLRGLPCDGCRQINTLSGYIQCEGGSVVSDASLREKQEINQFLNSGFYYE